MDSWQLKFSSYFPDVLSTVPADCLLGVIGVSWSGHSSVAHVLCSDIDAPVIVTTSLLARLALHVKQYEIWLHFYEQSGVYCCWEQRHSGSDELLLKLLHWQHALSRPQQLQTSCTTAAAAAERCVKQWNWCSIKQIKYCSPMGVACRVL